MHIGGVCAAFQNYEVHTARLAPQPCTDSHGNILMGAAYQIQACKHAIGSTKTCERHATVLVIDNSWREITLLGSNCTAHMQALVW
jgi:hypothetical protein